MGELAAKVPSLCCRWRDTGWSSTPAHPRTNSAAAHVEAIFVSRIARSQRSQHSHTNNCVSMKYSILRSFTTRPDGCYWRSLTYLFPELDCMAITMYSGQAARSFCTRQNQALHRRAVVTYPLHRPDKGMKIQMRTPCFLEALADIK